jgi:DNA-binding GntR family transcriptional regulator
VVGRFAERLTEPDLKALDFLERWQAAQGIRLDYESQTIEASAAAAPFTTLLKVRRGAPLLKETNTVYLPGGRPAGLFVSYYRHEYYQFNAMSNIGEREERGNKK